MDAKLIGARVREARVSRSMTQADLAQAANLMTKYVSNIECGAKIPKFETFIRIANALETDANTLLADVLVTTLLPAAAHSDKFSQLPRAEQMKLQRLFDIMIEDAFRQSSVD